MTYPLDDAPTPSSWTWLNRLVHGSGSQLPLTGRGLGPSHRPGHARDPAKLCCCMNDSLVLSEVNSIIPTEDVPLSISLWPQRCAKPVSSVSPIPTTRVQQMGLSSCQKVMC